VHEEVEFGGTATGTQGGTSGAYWWKDPQAFPILFSVLILISSLGRVSLGLFIPTSQPVSYISVFSDVGSPAYGHHPRKRPIAGSSTDPALYILQRLSSRQQTGVGSKRFWIGAETIPPEGHGRGQGFLAQELRHNHLKTTLIVQDHKSILRLRCQTSSNPALSRSREGSNAGNLHGHGKWTMDGFQAQKNIIHKQYSPANPNQTPPRPLPGKHKGKDILQAKTPGNKNNASDYLSGKGI
jgi:hypothetical protein